MKTDFFNVIFNLYYIKKRWKAAVSGCDIVLHVASPVPSGNVTDGIFLL
jgi:hypothetical protein